MGNRDVREAAPLPADLGTQALFPTAASLVTFAFVQRSKLTCSALIGRSSGFASKADEEG
jgi:hypothetical protein